MNPMNPNYLADINFNNNQHQQNFIYTPIKPKIYNTNSEFIHCQHTAITQNKLPFQQNNNQVNHFPFKENDLYNNQTPKTNKNITNFNNDQFALNNFNSFHSPKKEYYKPDIENIRETCKQLNFDSSPEVNNHSSEFESYNLSTVDFTEESILKFFISTQNKMSQYPYNTKIESLFYDFYSNLDHTKYISCLVIECLFKGFNDRNVNELFLFLVS